MVRSYAQLLWLALAATLGAAACGGEEFTSSSGSAGAGAGGTSSGGTAGSGSALTGGSAGVGGTAAGGSSGSGGAAGALSTGGTSSGGTAGSGGTPTGGAGGTPTGGAGGTSSGGTGGVTSTCPSGGLEDMKEAFSAPLSTSLWSKYFFSKGSVDSLNGDLSVKLGMDAGHFVGITSNATFGIDGCMMWVEVKKVVPPALNAETYFMATVSGSMDAEMTAAPDATAPSGLKLILSVEENGTEDNQSIHYNAANHRWWRMRFPPGKVAFDTSPDGKTWTERRSATRPSGMTSVFFELGAGTSGANTTQPAAAFDNLNLPPP